MTLDSRSFFVLFVPISLLLYWQFCKRPRQKLWLLCIISYVFYSLGSFIFVPLLFGLTLLTFWSAQRKRIIFGIVINLLGLILFKYWNFGAENLNRVTVAFGASPLIPLLQLALPLGISFYVFKHIGYLLDVRQKVYQPTNDLLAFATFSAFFAQVSAGPISSFYDTGRQLQTLPEKLTREGAYQGLAHISFGLAKKVLIADALSNTLQLTLFAQPAPQNGALWSWTAVIIFALQLYFDFSGYTDIAVGSAYLFGITLPPNFNNPYLARNPSDFWQRWHISLSNWFRFYLFLPFSRTLLRWTRRAEFSQYMANMITMLLVGLWHGPQWQFLLWGGYHGLLLNIYAWSKRRRIRTNISLLGNILLIIAVLIGWVFFLSPNFAFAESLLSGMFGLRGIGSFSDLPFSFGSLSLIIALLALLIVFTGITEAANLPRIRSPGIIFILGMIAALCLLSTNNAVPFVYIQF